MRKMCQNIIILIKSKLHNNIKVKSKLHNNIKVISVCIVTYINILRKHSVGKCKICVPTKENIYVRTLMRMASEMKHILVVCKIVM